MPITNNFVGNVQKWLAIADVDYYILFVKSWIPFNAWYATSYPAHNNNDSLILNDIKSTSNIFRDRIIALLAGQNLESQRFRQYLAELHLQLEARSIINKGKKISFSSIVIERNLIKSSTRNFRSFTYNVVVDPVGKPIKSVDSLVLVTSTGATRHLISQTKYDEDAIKVDPVFISMSEEQKKNLLLCYAEVNPNKPINIVSTSNKAPEQLALEGTSIVKFVNDPIKIAKALIEIIYKLRCVLFHGELHPTETNQQVYENAFYLMKILIRELQ